MKKSPVVTRICVGCNREFSHIKPYIKQRYCTRECYLKVIHKRAMGLTHKICNACKRDLPIEKFTFRRMGGRKAKNTRYNFTPNCKDCFRFMVRKYKQKPNPNRKRQTPDPEKNKARTIFRHARNRGRIPILPCVVCGEEAEGHHMDYNKPLEIVWVCKKHHMSIFHARPLDTPIAKGEITMKDLIRVISANERTHTNVIQVYHHEIIVKSITGGFECECRRATVIGYVPCEHGAICWHIRSAVNLLAEQSGNTCEWDDDEDSSRWLWGQSLHSHRYTVRAGDAISYVVTQEIALRV